jgi:predicted flap endonuclease-1-like 5' DNA nuclease
MFDQLVTAGPGTGTYTQHTFEIIIMLLGAFLLGLWLGWLLWSKYKQQVDNLMLENQSLKGSVGALNTDLSLAHTETEMLEIAKTELAADKAELLEENQLLHQQVDVLDTNLNDVQTENVTLENSLANLSASTPESANVPIEIVHSPVDLHVEDLMEGTDAAMPELEPLPSEIEGSAAVEEVVVPAPEMVEPEPMVVEAPTPVAPRRSIQMDLSAENLAEGTPTATIEKVAEVAPVAAVVAAAVPLTVDVRDDLKVIEGIGPKIEEILFKNQIYTYSQLAGTPTSRIKEILLAEGNRFAVHDPSTWPAQSLLAANEEWENLKAYQSYLNSGKKPD